MHLVIGLGNPGVQNDYTRHNLGFLVADALAEYAKVVFHPGKGEYWIANCSLNDSEIAILKPTTYMNNSGIAVKEFFDQHEVSLESILVVCDDFQLPLGAIRLRKNGSDGGHNGLSSIIYHLQTDQFARMRCGIASTIMPSEKSMMKEFVLERFHKDEFVIVNEMILRARDACIVKINKGIERAMNLFNTFLKEENI